MNSYFILNPLSFQTTAHSTVSWADLATPLPTSVVVGWRFYSEVPSDAALYLQIWRPITERGTNPNDVGREKHALLSEYKTFTKEVGWNKVKL